MICYWAADKSREIGKVAARDAAELDARLAEICTQLGVQRLWVMAREDGANGHWWTKE